MKGRKSRGKKASKATKTDSVEESTSFNIEEKLGKPTPKKNSTKNKDEDQSDESLQTNNASQSQEEANQSDEDSDTETPKSFFYVLKRLVSSQENKSAKRGKKFGTKNLKAQNGKSKEEERSSKTTRGKTVSPEKNYKSDNEDSDQNDEPSPTKKSKRTKVDQGLEAKKSKSKKPIDDESDDDKRPEDDNSNDDDQSEEETRQSSKNSKRAKKNSESETSGDEEKKSLRKVGRKAATKKKADKMTASSQVGKHKQTPKKAAKKKRGKSEGHSESEDEVSETEYEVSRITDVYFKKDGTREFLVHWKGFSSNDSTWEPEKYLNCKDLIENYLKKCDAARNFTQRKLRENRSVPQRLEMFHVGQRLPRGTHTNRINYAE